MKKPIILMTLLVFMFLVGCATTPVKLNPTTQFNDINISKVLSKYDVLIVNLSAAEGIKMEEKDFKEMNSYVVEAVKKYHPNRFRKIRTNIVGDNKNELVLEVKFTEFTNRLSLMADLPGKDKRISGEIFLKNSQGEIITTGTLLKHRGSAFYGGEHPFAFNTPEAIKSLVTPFAWLEKRFAEGIAKGLPF